MASPTSATRDDSPASSAGSRWFRGDVDGLRAVAIVLVVGYHAGLPRLGAGFIGVDVFFVISGFLISRNLLREAETTDRIALSGFWARRIRRLVPALGLVVITTLVVSSFVLPRFELADVSRQGAAATLYVSNMVFAVDAQNYFGADVAASPFLHTWSLGVEEQFYILWPVLFSVVCWSRRRRLRDLAADHRRATLVVAFSITFVASMALNLALTAQGSTWAFFGLPARAWEFAVAGLLAAVPVPHALRHLAARTVAGIAGLLVLVVGLRVMSETTVYPGLWALFPVVGTSLVILAGETGQGDERPTFVSRVLALAPMQWLGRVSYSWYLWHWPAMVLAVVWLDDPSVTVRSVAGLVTLPVAWLAYRYVETPLRFTPLVAGSQRRTFVFGALVTVVALLVAGAVWATAPRVSADELLTAAPPADASLEERVARSMEAYRSRAETACPAVGAQTTERGDVYCLGGDLDSDRSVLLVGDSHAGQWHPTLDRVAREQGVKLIVRQHNACPAIPVLYRTVRENDTRPYTYCDQYQQGDLRVLDDLGADAVIVAMWSGAADRIVDRTGKLADDPTRVALWDEGVRTLLGELAARDVRVGWIFDQPTLAFNASRCLDTEASVAACEPTRSDATAIAGPQLDVERRLVGGAGGVATLDLTDVLCDAERCRLEVDGVLTYVDEQHLTDAFAASLDEQLAALLAQTMGP